MKTILALLGFSLAVAEWTADAATFTVATTDENGPGSLRQAILDANANPGPDIIEFDLPGSGAHSIAPVSLLPTITDAVVLDGWTQPDYAGQPIIELNGLNAGGAGNGLTIMASNCVVRGLVINRFAGDGILLQDGGGHIIEGNYLGTDVHGTNDLGNGGRGFVITNSFGNMIGGATPASRNVISGNQRHGISILNGSSSNQVQGNIIGLDASGLVRLRNENHGILVYSANANVIGGNTPSARNIISGNGWSGIHLQNTSFSNLVQGNLIGTDITGAKDLGNSDCGVKLSENSSDNHVGGTEHGAGNVVSGNNDVGIALENQANANRIEGNYVGTSIFGTNKIPNRSRGITFVNSASNCIGGLVIGSGNLISGNSQGGVRIASGAMHNLVLGNLIGLDATGTAKLGNADSGIALVGATNNLVGGTTSDARNVIAGNGDNGIHVAGASYGNCIQGNYIGTSAAGEASIANNQRGIALFNSFSNIIGGAIAGAGNLVSGNGRGGIRLESGCTDNIIQGNRIGLDATGTNPVGNEDAGIALVTATNNLVGGLGPLARNIIAGNGGSGIHIAYSASSNTIHGNLIGSDADGVQAIPNGFNGIALFASYHNRIGGEEPDAGNLIAFNLQNGVYVNSGHGNCILGNAIHANRLLGIDLGSDGVSTNDLDDLDSGPNDLQNFPILTLAQTSGGILIIGGTLNTIPDTPGIILEFFANESPDPSGYGEGQTFIGRTVVSTDVNGNAVFAETLPIFLPAGFFVTATATLDNNTSEFSRCVRLDGPALAIRVSDGKLVVAWPDWATGGQLVQTDSLNPPIVWTPVTNDVAQVGDELSVTLPFQSGTRFFKLAAQPETNDSKSSR